MKLNPNLDDWWTAKKRTDLKIDENWISGAGVGLKVVLGILLDSNVNLYTHEAGTHEDDLYILIINKNSKLDNQLPKVVRNSEESRLRKWFGEPIQLVEFILNQEAMKLFEIEKVIDLKDIRNEDIKYNLYFHDNCFFGLYSTPPINKVILNLLERIKHLHSFYLDKEIETKKVEEKIYDLLSNKKSISIFSKEEDGKLRVVYKVRSKKFLKRFFSFTDDEEVIID